MKTITPFVFYHGDDSITVTPENEIKANEILVSWNAVYSVYSMNSQYQNRGSLTKMVYKFTELSLKESYYLVNDAENKAKQDNLSTV